MNNLRPIKKWSFKDSILRFEFPRPDFPEGGTKANPPFPVTFYRGSNRTPIRVAVVTFNEIRAGSWTATEIVQPAKLMDECILAGEQVQKCASELSWKKRVLYKVHFGRGEALNQNVDEIFWFATLPTGIKARNNDLSKWVYNLVLREESEQADKVRLETDAVTKAWFEKFPVRLPHENSNVNHYKNQKDVLWELHRQQWPRLFEATEKLKFATTEETRKERQEQAWLAYVADHTAIYGKPPKVQQEYETELLQNHFQLLSDSHQAQESRVEKRSWQLACGWIEKNYYRMNERELEKAFARDWNYPLGVYKGNTLAKHARKLGLMFALKKGHPEERPNLLPPG